MPRIVVQTVRGSVLQQRVQQTCQLMLLYVSLLQYKLNEITYEPRHEISNNVVRATSKGSDQPAHMRSLIRAFASRLNI